jgi:hypothetical protein
VPLRMVLSTVRKSLSAATVISIEVDPIGWFSRSLRGSCC